MRCVASELLTIVRIVNGVRDVVAIAAADGGMAVVKRVDGMAVEVDEKAPLAVAAKTATTVTRSVAQGLMVDRFFYSGMASRILLLPCPSRNER